MAGMFCGSGLIYCAVNRQLLAPSFIICAHCPWWLPYAEATIGITLFFGLFARCSAIGLIGLLCFAIGKHGICECLDLLPMLGMGLYFLISGRGSYSIDRLLNLENRSETRPVELGYLLLRILTGSGLMILAIDEKLLHPQLALDVLTSMPNLNFMHAYMSNSLFVLLTGLVELSLGFLIAAGTFPRTAAVILAGTFAATSLIFGTSEIFGHASFYGIVILVVLRGRGQVTLPTYLRCLSDCLRFARGIGRQCLALGK
ncbi:MAG TPA: hypothetical protein V6C72_12850 [Chroococcales cyanobacterium]